MAFFFSPLFPSISSRENRYPLAMDMASHQLRYHTWSDAIMGFHYIDKRFSPDSLFHAVEYFDIVDDIGNHNQDIPDNQIYHTPNIMMIGLLDLLIFPLLPRFGFLIATQLVIRAAGVMCIMDLCEGLPVEAIFVINIMLILCIFIPVMTIAVALCVTLCIPSFILEMTRCALGIAIVSLIALVLTTYYNPHHEQEQMGWTPITVYALKEGIYTFNDLVTTGLYTEMQSAEPQENFDLYRHALFGIHKHPEYRLANGHAYRAVLTALKDNTFTMQELNQYVRTLSVGDGNRALVNSYYQRFFAGRTNFLILLMENNITAEKFIECYRAAQVSNMHAWLFDIPDFTLALLQWDDDYSTIIEQIRNHYIVTRNTMDLLVIDIPSEERTFGPLITEGDHQVIAAHMIGFIAAQRNFQPLLK